MYENIMPGACTRALYYDDIKKENSVLVWGKVNPSIGGRMGYHTRAKGTKANPTPDNLTKG